MPQARRMCVNPNNPNQIYVLWDTGRIVAKALAGDTPPPELPHDWDNQISNYSGAVPLCADEAVAVAPYRYFQITDWASNPPSGYSGDIYGRIYAWGDATPVNINNMPVMRTYPWNGWRDFAMNPAANGAGYAMMLDGWVFTVGAEGTVLPATYIDAVPVRFLMPEYDDRKYMILDHLGRRWSENGAVGMNCQYGGEGNWLWYHWLNGQNSPWTISAAFYDGFDAGEGHGWILNFDGTLWSVNGSQAIHWGQQLYRPGNWWAADVAILDNGLGATPLRLAILDLWGNIRDIYISTPPNVTVSSPADPTTDTNRPRILVHAYDAEGDAINEWQCRVFTDAQYGIGGFDPSTSPCTWEKDVGLPDARLLNTFIPDVKLVNDTYRAYARAKDTSSQWSAWAYKQFVLNVVPPNAPTITVTAADDVTEGVKVDVTFNQLGTFPSAVVGVEYRDGESEPWRYVREGDAIVVDGGGDGSTVDREYAFGVDRTYRARVYVPYPELESNYSPSSTVAVFGEVWTLQDVYTSTIVPVSVREFDEESRVVAGTFNPDGREDNVVIWGKKPVKLPTFDLKFWALNAEDHATLMTMIKSRHVLLLKDPFGENRYIAPNGNIKKTLLRATPLPDETTPIRNARTIDVPVAQVKRPPVGPASGAYALLGDD